MTRQLQIDLGNSRLKWIWVMAGELDVDSAGEGDVAEFERRSRADAARPPDKVLLSSVAGRERTRQVAEACQRLWSAPVRELRSRAEQGGVRCAYADPASLGVDRWLAIVGAAATYGTPVIVWDLGTAATLDAVDATGQHLGGIILPGPHTMLASLAEKTKLAVPDSFDNSARLQPGRSTRECIVHGVLSAQAGAARLFREAVEPAGGTSPRLVVTGGAAASVLQVLGEEAVHDPWLVFRGMLMV